MASPVKGGFDPQKFDIVGGLSNDEPPLFKIMQYSVGVFLLDDPEQSKEAVATARSLRLVSKLWKDLADGWLPRIYWLDLEQMPLSSLRNLMADARLRAHAELQLSDNEEPEYFARFLALTSELRSRGSEISKELSILGPHYYLKEQKLFDEALEKIWTKMHRKVQTAEEIRAILHSRQNQKNIQSINTLNLSNLELRVLPPEIKLFTGLKELFLDGNELKTLPEWIGGLTGLETLSLCHNFFLKFPNPIMNLSQLQRLDLTDNELTAGKLHEKF